MSVNYMLISIIILAVAIAIPFFTFEKRKPKARHVVMIAVMSALTVVANIICAYTIPFHAGTALVIITGIAFGPQTGFLTGVLSRFVCNFFMGQGVWTPWEMAAWGLLGVLAGIIMAVLLMRSRIPCKDGHFDKITRYTASHKKNCHNNSSKSESIQPPPKECLSRLCSKYIDNISHTL